MIARLSVFLCLAVVVAVASAFAPSESPLSSKWSAKGTTYTPMKRVFASPPPSFSRNRCPNGVCMATDVDAEAAKLREQAQKLREEAAAAAGVSVEELAAASKNSDGTVYDDEPMLEPPRENLSSSMKERLRREASTGLDSNQGQTNVILYISLGVAVLVLLAGQGILY
ncbi:hypothetical protein ACHAWF_011450 [Thalassiosira exigua]